MKIQINDSYSSPIKNSFLIVNGEEAKECNDILHLTFAGVKLANLDGWFGTSDPFFYISKINADGSFSRVHQSEVVMNNLDPKWKPASVNMVCIILIIFDFCIG